MYRLESTEPQWLTLIEPDGEDDPGVEVLFAPITRSMHRWADQAALAVHVKAGEEPGETASPAVKADAGDAYSESLMRAGIRDWRGIGDAAGEPVGVTPETLDGFIATKALFQAADAAYVMPDVLRRMEKNVSSASRSGTSGARTPAGTTAAVAGKPAKNAHMSSKRPARPRAKTPGPSSKPASARSG